MKDFCVIGAGVSGSTVANLLSQNNTVEVFEKSRGAGGRSSNRKFSKGMSFDHGVQYVSPKDKKFEIFVKNLQKRGVLKVWKGNHIDFTFKDKQTEKYIGKKGNNDLCKFLLKKVKVYYQHKLKKIVFNSNFWTVFFENGSKYSYKNLILTCPYPQLNSLSKKYMPKYLQSLDVKMKPNITIMCAYKKNKKIPLSSIRFNNKLLGWSANENSKDRFKSNLTLWTIQSTETFAKKYINNYRVNSLNIYDQMINEFEKLTGFKKKDIVYKSIHGWKYSYSNQSTKYKNIWSKKNKIGFCGDWFQGPKIENAWISASDLYKRIR